VPANWSKVCVAEAIGAFTLVFIGVLAISGVHVAGLPDGMANLASIGLAHGLAIAVMVAALGAISGGHFNPAVTFGFVLTGRMGLLTGLMYWWAQLAGAALAGLLIAWLFGPGPVGAATPELGKDVGFTAGVVLEAVTTFFLVVVVFGTAVDVRAPKGIYPLAIGLTVALDIMAIGPLTGAAMNPARAFGPALASGHWHNHLVFWVGPLLGGAAAGLVQHFFLMKAAQSVAHQGGPTPGEQRGEDNTHKMEKVAAGQGVETPAGHEVSSVPAGRSRRVVGPT
jgi:aquaporin TIP